ncbi:reverse transcriptase domain-containing protein [Tanacetum coccineum]
MKMKGAMNRRNNAMAGVDDENRIAVTNWYCCCVADGIGLDEQPAISNGPLVGPDKKLVAAVGPHTQAARPGLVCNKMWNKISSAKRHNKKNDIGDVEEDEWRGDIAFKCFYPRVYALELCKSIDVASKMDHSNLGYSFHQDPRRGEFSVASVRKLIDDNMLPEVASKTRWIKAVPIKVNVHAWKVKLDYCHADNPQQYHWLGKCVLDLTDEMMRLECMSTRSNSSNLFSPLRDPESLIRRRNLGEPSSLFDFEEVMSIPRNNMGPPPAGPPPPNNNGLPPVGRPIVLIPIQATDFGLRHHMIQKITQHVKQNGVSDDAFVSLFPYSLTHHDITWYDRLPRNSIHSFDDMMRKFLSKYFPPSMVTKLRNEITKFEQKPHESLFEAWERYKLSIDRCPNHIMLLATQIDTFYNGLTLSHRDTINAAAGGTFMQKTPEECYEFIENMTAHHNHWDTSTTRDETSRNISSSTTTTESPEVVRQLEMMNKNFCPTADGYTQEAAYAITAITTRSGVAYDGPSIPPTSSPRLKEVECETEATKDKVQNTSLGSTAHVQTLVVQDPILEPEVIPKPKPKPSIPYPSRLNDQKLCEKDDNLASKFVEIFRELHFELSFADALLHMPKFASMFKKIVECLALADLGASINLMPLSIWKKLSLPELTPTRMILELADQSTTSPSGITEDVFVKVGKFHFLADFVVVDYVVDPRGPLILGRPFLRTGRALIDVYGEELTLRVDDEAITFTVGQTSRYSYNNAKSVNRIDVIDVSCEEYAQEVLGFSDSSTSGNPTPSLDPILSTYFPSLTHFEGGDFILEEIEDCLTNNSISPGIDDPDFDQEGDLLLLKKLLNNDP